MVAGGVISSSSFNASAVSSSATTAIKLPCAILSPTLTASSPHDAGVWRRDLHGRLVALERNQRILGGDMIAGFYQYLDHVDFPESHRYQEAELVARRPRCSFAYTVTGFALSGFI